MSQTVIGSNKARSNVVTVDVAIIGAGHVPLLLQMAQNAPEFESVPALTVLGRR